MIYGKWHVWKGTASWLIFGNVADGLSFVGPFDHSADADEWAEKNARGEDWIMTNLKHPEA